MGDDDRTSLRLLFRLRDSGQAVTRDQRLNDPYTAWTTVKPTPGFASPPPSILNTPPAEGVRGRFIVFPDTKETYILTTLAEGGRYIPPYPGPTPEVFNHQFPPIFLDGSLGLYESRFYALEFDPSRPWLGFQIVHRARRPWDRPIELWHPSDFFDARDMNRKTFLGGRWHYKKIRRLLKRRRDAEQWLWSQALLGNIENLMALKKEFGSSLPYLDDLKLSCTTTWRSWMDGRDAIANTLRYVSEVLALGRWLVEIRRQKSSKRPAPKQPEKYLGVWSGSIDNQDNWSFVLKSPLPIYANLVIPPEHPLHAHALEHADGASFDADERHRANSFLEQLPFGWIRNDRFTCGQWYAGDLHYKVSTPTDRFNCSLPLSYTSIHDPHDSYLDSVGYPRNAAHLSWTSSIVRESSIYRSLHSDVSQNLSIAEQEQTAAWKYMIATMERHRPSVDEVLHPATHFLPARDRTRSETRYFLERQKGLFFWVTFLDSDEARLIPSNWKGYFHRISEDDILLSDWPWPVIGETLPFFDPQHIFSKRGRSLMESSNFRRVYLQCEPGDEGIPIQKFGNRPPAIVRDVKGLAGPLIRGQLRTYWMDSEMDVEESSPPLGLSAWPSNNSLHFSTEHIAQPEFSIMRLSSALDFETDMCTFESTYTSGDTSSVSSLELDNYELDDYNEGPLPSFNDSGTSDSMSRSDCLVSPSAISSNASELLDSQFVDALLEQVEPSDARLAMRFLTSLALGTAAPSLESEVLTHGAMTPAQVLQEIQMKRMWRDIMDAKDRMEAIDPEPTSSESLETDDMDVCFLRASSDGDSESDESDPMKLWACDHLSNPEAQIPASILSAETLEYRRRAGAYVAYRLNKPRAPIADVTKQVVPVICSINCGSGGEIIVYPMRLHNLMLPGKTTEGILPSFLELAAQENFGNIILLSTHFEGDGLVTMDIGFQCPEDAFGLWIKSGLLYEGHYWKVEPLKRMSSQLVMFPPPSALQSHDHRLTRLCDFIAHEMQIEDDEMAICMEQMCGLLACYQTEESMGRLAIGDFSGDDMSDQAPVKLGHKHLWATWDEVGFGIWMRGWRVTPGLPLRPQEGPNVPSDLTSNSKWPSISIEMTSAEKNGVYRHSLYDARRKHDIWSSDDLQLDSPPKLRSANGAEPSEPPDEYDSISTCPSKSRIFEGFVELWCWYQNVEQVATDARAQANYKYQHLTQLPIPSTPEQQRLAVRVMSLRALDAALRPSERFKDLRGEVLLLVWRAIASMERIS
ncbi:hypothetical protein FRC19_002341 [Serendipita sp. 401]|nr:hypothetical protein FRC19_002341 [Serendipita sp. 401]KAG9054397.1 hypothetical protein FS842_005247 [Serendipita sp. 407]